ncbi:hypothetical protein [Pontibacter populi]|uniref:Uncharacterized protein n=1 Tax=Pontibacter populi TaxID=890055 RepID=A0ABV1RPR3_9BACT
MLGLASLALGSVSGLNQLLTARKQQRMADRIQAVKPEYQIAGALHENVANARNMANGNMPGMGNALNQIHATSANGARAAALSGSGNNALATIAAMQGQEANALNNLHDQQANYRMQMQGNLQGQLNNLAQEQRNKWQYDKADKYTEDSAAKSALTGAAMNNKHSAISSLSNLAITGLQGLKSKKQGQDEQHQSNVSNYHRGQLNGVKSTPLFGGTLSSYPFQ